MKNISQKYVEDCNWAMENYLELQKDYANKWVAIVGEEVVSSGRSIKEIERKAKKRTNRSVNEIPVIYIECGSHVY